MLGEVPQEPINEEQLLNGAPTSLRFDQWKRFSREWRPSVGIDPAVGSLCARRKWKHKNIQRFVFVPRCSTSLAFLLIFTVSFFLSRVEQAGQGAVQPSYAFKFSIFILFFKKYRIFGLLTEWTCKSGVWHNKPGLTKGLLTLLKKSPSQPVAAECSQM